MEEVHCQMDCTSSMQQGIPRLAPLPLRLRLVISTLAILGPGFKRWARGLLNRSSKPATVKKARAGTPVTFAAGDWVRIRPLAEIKAGLNANRRLKGCQFMPEMEPYCGTIQRVFKPVERFLNEGDYTIRKASGIVLLENLYCQGVALAGRCDRSCFYFWRVEWLEHLTPEELPSAQPDEQQS